MRASLVRKPLNQQKSETVRGTRHSGISNVAIRSDRHVRSFKRAIADLLIQISRHK
jgi:hypothetical protein